MFYTHYKFKSSGVALTGVADFVSSSTGTEFIKDTGDVFIKQADGTLKRTGAVTSDKSVNIATDTNLETWADALPVEGNYDITTTVVQNGLPIGQWYITFTRLSSDAVANLYHRLEAVSIDGTLKYENIQNNNVWSGWLEITKAAVGGGTDHIFYENDIHVTTNYAITTGKNAISAGPITVDNGVVVTIPTGSTWSIT